MLTVGGYATRKMIPSIHTQIAPAHTCPDTHTHTYTHITPCAHNLARTHTCETVHSHHALRSVAHVQKPLNHVHARHSAVLEEQIMMRHAMFSEHALIVCMRVV